MEAPRSPPARHHIVALLHENPVIQKLKEKFEFICTATVETGGGVDFQEACRWAIPDDHAPYRNLEGRVLPHPNVDDDRALWSFEFEEDAVLFAMKFGGIIRGPISVSLWRRGVIAAGQNLWK